jgi:hypothetical protein
VTLQPKHVRPGKPGHIWPGVHKIPLSFKNQSKPWKVNCPAPLCFFVGSYEFEASARKAQETHQCPWFGGGTTTISWGIMSSQFLSPMWAELDRLVDFVKKEDEDPAERGKASQQAKGLAFALATLMPPFFSTVEEISHEALVRWEKRQAGEDYETPGLGRLRFKVPPGAHEMTPAGLYHADVMGTKHEPEYHPSTASRSHGLDQATIAEIVKSAKNGFPARMLATVHSVSEKVILDIIRTHGQKV